MPEPGSRERIDGNAPAYCVVCGHEILIMAYYPDYCSGNCWKEDTGR